MDIFLCSCNVQRHRVRLHATDATRRAIQDREVARKAQVDPHGIWGSPGVSIGCEFQYWLSWLSWTK